MRKFNITSPAWQGNAELMFNTDGQLIKIDLSQAVMTVDIIRAFKQRAPVLVEYLEAAFAATQATVVETDFEATFEMFWHNYPNKRNRHLAADHWPKMSKTEQVQAYMAVIHYRKYAEKNENWYNPQIGHTWLKKREFLNDWNKL